jgi:3'-5' exonuclease
MQSEHLTGVLFIDIETVPMFSAFEQMSDGMQAEWERKARTLKHTDPSEDPAYLFGERAGIFSEFAKIVCISIGTLYKQGESWKIRLRSLAGHDEQRILSDLAQVIEKVGSTAKDVRFCGHNIKEFDIPFICRRFVINGLPLPYCLQLSGKKPWEVTHIDTMEMWKFGDNKNYTSLSLLSQVLGVPSPKSDMDGSMVGKSYWTEGDVERISNYCIQDVLAVARVFLKLRGLPIDPLPEVVEGLTL